MCWLELGADFFFAGLSSTHPSPMKTPSLLKLALAIVTVSTLTEKMPDIFSFSDSSPRSGERAYGRSLDCSGMGQRVQGATV